MYIQFIAYKERYQKYFSYSFDSSLPSVTSLTSSFLFVKFDGALFRNAC